MEDKAGTALFDRLPKGVRLTPCGLRLLEEAAPILAACEALDARMETLEDETPLHLVSSITIASFWLPRILRRFAAVRPPTPVEVEVISAGDAVELLRAGGADLALVEGVPPQGPFLCTPFASYRLVVVAAPFYRTGPDLSIQELCGEKLLLRQKGSAIRDTFDSALLLSGLTPRPVWTSINSTALIEMCIRDRPAAEYSGALPCRPFGPYGRQFQQMRKDESPTCQPISPHPITKKR